MSVDECQAAGNGMFLISNIIVQRIAIGAMYNHHIANLTKIGLIISENQIEEIVDFNSSVIKRDSIFKLEFEKNPNLVMGVADVASRVRMIDNTTIKLYGISKFHDCVFSSDYVTFSNFSTTFYNFYTVSSRNKNRPWFGFIVTYLTLEGRLFDLSNFSGSPLSTLTIRNVISINGVELVPENFLAGSINLEKLLIYNTYCLTLPKFFFQKLYDSGSVTFNLTLHLDIWNIQQDTLSPRLNLTRLEKLNQVNLTDEMRDVLASLNDTSKCSIFCKATDGTQLNCSDLSEKEKRVCGICVKNIKEDTNLTKELKDVCDITNTQSSTVLISTSDYETSIGTPMTATTTGKTSNNLDKNINQHTKKERLFLFSAQLPDETNPYTNCPNERNKISEGERQFWNKNQKAFKKEEKSNTNFWAAFEAKSGLFHFTQPRKKIFWSCYIHSNGYII